MNKPIRPARGSNKSEARKARVQPVSTPSSFRNSPVPTIKTQRRRVRGGTPKPIGATEPNPAGLPSGQFGFSLHSRGHHAPTPHLLSAGETSRQAAKGGGATHSVARNRTIHRASRWYSKNERTGIRNSLRIRNLPHHRLPRHQFPRTSRGQRTDPAATGVRGANRVKTRTGNVTPNGPLSELDLLPSSASVQCGREI